MNTVLERREENLNSVESKISKICLNGKAQKLFEKPKNSKSADFMEKKLRLS